MGGAVDAVGSAVGAVGGLFGSGSKAGILGTGQFEADRYGIDKNAYNNDQNDALRAQFAQQLAASQQQQAPQIQAAQLDPSQQAQFRAAQTGLVGQLQQQANGQGPSLAALQMQQGNQANLRSAMALGTTGYGVNPALAQRNILQQANQANQATAQQAAMARMQEQLNARTQLANVAQQGRGQDLGLAQSNADLQQNASVANQNASLANQNQKNQMAQFYNSGINSINNQASQNSQNYEQTMANQTAGTNATNEDAYKTAGAARGNVVGKIGSAIGMAFAAGGMVPDQTNTTQVLNPSHDVAFAGSGSPADKTAVPGPAGEMLAGGPESAAMGGDAGAGMGSGAELAMLASKGAVVPGKPKVPGDSPKNDTVPAMLSPKEIVIPVSVALDAMKNPDSPKLKNFIEALRKKHGYDDHSNERDKKTAAAMKKMIGAK